MTLILDLFKAVFYLILCFLVILTIGLGLACAVILVLQIL